MLRLALIDKFCELMLGDVVLNVPPLGKEAGLGKGEFFVGVVQKFRKDRIQNVIDGRFGNSSVCCRTKKKKFPKTSNCDLFSHRLPQKY